MFIRLILPTASIALMLAGSARADSDEEFLKHAMMGDNSEMTLGDLGAKNGQDEQVRNLGSVLETDHGQAKKEVGLLARKMNVDITEEMTPEAKEELQKLQGLSGADFDKEYVRYMIEDHQKDISEFKEKAGEGKGQVSTLAAHTVPVLEKRLEMTKAIKLK